MRWGRVAVLLFTGVVGLGLGFVVAQPWSSPTTVGAIELNDDDEAAWRKAWRKEDAFDVEVRDDDGNGDDEARTGNGEYDTDDGRDGTRDGDTVGGGGTGTTGGGGGAVAGATDTDDGAVAVGGGGTTAGDGDT